MSAAVAAILEGMPEPRDLRLHQVAGRCVITAGATVLFCYDTSDTAMRNMAICALRRLGFTGRAVAAVPGLTETYVARLHNRAMREGSPALIGQDRPGRPGKLPAADWEQAEAWREQGVSDAGIGRRAGVANTTVMRRPGPRSAGQPEAPPQPCPPVEEPLFPLPEMAPAPAPASGAGLVPAGFRRGGGPAAAGPRITGGSVCCRYAGAMLLHAFSCRVDAGAVLAAAGAAPGRDGLRYADVALLSATSACFALGAATIEQFKHLTAASAGPLAGLAVLPDVRTIRPRLAAIADATGPLALQALFARAMLAADPVTSGVYYVDDHFLPYTGARPVGKGWASKRGRAGRGHADTHVTACDGRAVCFVTGEPSGLATTLPLALAELSKAVQPGGKILLGFDRGGACPQVFKHCKEHGADWVTCPRAPLAVPAGLPVLSAITVNGRRRQVVWAEEMVTIRDYGQARQLTLFEDGKAALQVLTSDEDSCPAAVLSWLNSRWREENFLKYASGNYGIDKICDYIAAIETNTKVTGNPARKTANAAVRQAEKALTAAREDMAVMLNDPAIPAAVRNTRLIPAAARKITAARKALTQAKAARDKIPAKLPASQINPGAQTAILRTGRRGLQMVLRLLAHNAEHWRT